MKHQGERRVTPLTKYIACGVWLKVAGEALIHFAGETCVVLPVTWGDSEASTDWMEAWGFRKINILFVRNINPVGLKGDVEVTGGELCDVTLQHSTVPLQQIWERSPDPHWWSCKCRRWRITTGKKSQCILLGPLLSQDVWLSCCMIILPATFTVLSVDEKHLCSALHVINLSCFHWLEETVTSLIIWVVFAACFTLLLGVSLPSISQITLASKTVWTKHVAFTSDAAIITVLKLGISTWMEGGALE